LLPNISEKARYYSLPFGGGGFQTRLYQEFEIALKIYFQGNLIIRFSQLLINRERLAKRPVSIWPAAYRLEGFGVGASASPFSVKAGRR